MNTLRSAWDAYQSMCVRWTTFFKQKIKHLHLARVKVAVDFDFVVFICLYLVPISSNQYILQTTIQIHKQGKGRNGYGKNEQVELKMYLSSAWPQLSWVAGNEQRVMWSANIVERIRWSVELEHDGGWKFLFRYDSLLYLSVRGWLKENLGENMYVDIREVDPPGPC